MAYDFEKVKSFIINHFEAILVIILLGSITFILFFVAQKIGFLSFYYLPVLIASATMGIRTGVLTSFLCVLAVVFTIIVFPQMYTPPPGNAFLGLALNTLPWMGFLILSAYTVGYFSEVARNQYEILKNAHIGIVEILIKMMESADKYTEGHSIRVSKIAVDIASVMGLSQEEIENIRVAALLHDIGKFDISKELLLKTSALTQNDTEKIMTHSQKGAEMVSKMGPILKNAVPLILAHHDYYIKDMEKNDKEIPLGAKTIAVADAYDAMVTDRSYRKGRPPWQAIQEIRKASGTQFDPNVVEAFEKIVTQYISYER